MRKRRTRHRAYVVHCGQPFVLVHAHGGTLPEKHFGAPNQGLGPLGNVWGPSGDPGGDLLRFGVISGPNCSPFGLHFSMFFGPGPQKREKGCNLSGFGRDGDFDRFFDRFWYPQSSKIDGFGQGQTFTKHSK